MITLARLIVIAKHTLLIDNKGKSILEAMCASGKRRRHTPHHHLYKRIFRNDVAFVQKKFRIHVGESNNGN
ncbi:hypothetical protein GeomeDRAFT_1522 [Geobacter metallireducens RCH3]|nr:hypothetical protein GeomeDRAFT_1522 [Geobacter metallireducens RCH3]